MSSDLMWQPFRKWKSLSTEIKLALKKSGRLDDSKTIVLAYNDYSYLEGLRDAGISDADILLKAIDKYEEIILREEF